MSTNKNPLGLTDVILRDAHQSLLATRMRTEDMLPIAGKLDELVFGLSNHGVELPLTLA